MKPEEQREADSFSTFLNMAQQITQRAAPSEVGGLRGGTLSADSAPSARRLIEIIARQEPVPVADLIRYTDLSFLEFSEEIRRLETAGAITIERDERLHAEVVRLTDIGRLELGADT